MGERGRRPSRPVAALLAVGAALVLAAVVLGVLTARASAAADDRTAALAAARVHVVDLGAAASDPVARTRAIDGAAGAWRERLSGASAPSAATPTVVQEAGLESIEGGDDGHARALVVGLVGGDGGPRAFRAEVTLSRTDGRWLVDSVGDLP